MFWRRGDRSALAAQRLLYIITIFFFTIATFCTPIFTGIYILQANWTTDSSHNDTNPNVALYIGTFGWVFCVFVFSSYIGVLSYILSIAADHVLFTPIALWRFVKTQMQVCKLRSTITQPCPMLAMSLQQYQPPNLPLLKFSIQQVSFI